MASLDTIRKITIRATTQGVDTATRQVSGLSESFDNLALSSARAEKSQISVDDALAKQSRTFGIAVSVTTAFAAAVVAGVAATVEINRELAEMAVAARRAGVEIERFQGLKFAAAIEGISSQQFATGLERMASRLNDAARNENEMSRLLDANNIKFKEGNRVIADTNRLLEIGRNLISRAANEQDKIKMAEMLGLTKEWVPLLDKSKDAFEQAASEASSLGLVINRETILRAEEFDREWRRASLVFPTWVKAKIAEILPDINDLIQKAREFAEKFPRPSEEARKPPAMSFFGGVLQVEQGSDAEKVFNNMAQSIDILSESSEKFGGIAEQLRASLQALFGLEQDGAHFWQMNLEFAHRAAQEYEQTAIAGRMIADAIKSWPNPSSSKFQFAPSSVVPAREIGQYRDAWDRATQSVEKHIATLRADAMTVGQSESARAGLRTEFQLLEAAAQANAGVTQEQVTAYMRLRGEMDAVAALQAAGIKLDADRAAQFRRLTGEVDAATQAFLQLRLKAETKFQGETIFFSQTEMRIAQEMRRLFGSDWKQFMDSDVAATMRLNAQLKEFNEIASNAFTGFISDVANGVSAVDALSNAIGKVGNSLVNLGSKGIFDSLSKGLSGGGFSFDPMSFAAVGAGMILGQIQQSQQRRRQEQEQRRQAQIEMERRIQALRERQFMAGVDTSTREGALSAFDFRAAQQRQQVLSSLGPGAAIAQIFGRAIPELVQLEATLAAEREQIIKQFAEQAIAKEKEIALRRQSLQDQLFIAMQDQDTLAGQLAIFDREALRAREEEQERGGQALVDLEALQAFQRQQIIKDFNEQAIAETKRAEEERLATIERAAKNIQSYLNQLLSGPGSTLSAQQRLTNATAAYNEQLALAQSGNLEALTGITQFAENLRLAARDFFGSSTGYQSIFDQIQQQLGGLSAPILSADPVVAAIQETTMAIEEGNDIATTANSLQTSANSIAQTQQTLLTSINNLQTTAAQQLQLLNTALTPAALSVTLFAQNQAVNNNMITALNKIVINTGLTAFALGFMTNGINVFLPFGTSAVSGQSLTVTPVFHSGGQVPGAGDVPITAQGGEFIVRRQVAAANASWLAAFNRTGRTPTNDNEALVAEMRALTGIVAGLVAEVAALRRSNESGHARTAQAVGGASDRQMQAARLVREGRRSS